MRCTKKLTSFDGYVEKKPTSLLAKPGGVGGWKYKKRDLKSDMKDTYLRWFNKHHILNKHFNPLETESGDTVAEFGSEFNFPFVNIQTLMKIAQKAMSVAAKLVFAVTAAIAALKVAYRHMKAAAAAAKMAAKTAAAAAAVGAKAAHKAAKYVNWGAAAKGAVAAYATRALMKDHYEMFLEIHQEPVCPWPTPVCPWPTTAACLGEPQAIAAAGCIPLQSGLPKSGLPKPDRRRAIAFAFL